MSSATTLSNTSINIPQLLAVALVGFLALRWFLKPGPGAGTAPRGSSTRSLPLDISKIEQVSAMFPQLDRRHIAWDLSRNGQNVSATTERVLAGRGLDTPPPSFQPNIPPAASSATNSTTSGSRTGAKSAQGQDLITRYGLQSKVNGKGKEAEPSEEAKRNAWSSDKAARADGLKRRREEMILAARRKMLEKEQASGRP